MGFPSLKETEEITKETQIDLTNNLLLYIKKNLKRQNNGRCLRQLLLNKLYKLILKINLNRLPTVQGQFTK